jgi:hypothetical protein
MGALGMSSQFEAWSSYDDSSAGDKCIADAMTRDNFRIIWWSLQYVEKVGALPRGADGKLKDPISRVRWFIDKMQESFSKLWTCGCEVALDEWGTSGSLSRFCNVGSYNPSKPQKYHIPWICTADGTWNFPIRFQVFLKGEFSSLNELVLSKLIPGDLVGKGHVMITDSRYVCVCVCRVYQTHSDSY